MRELVRIGNKGCKCLLETPSAPTDAVVLFLPGISGGALSDRFQTFVDACTQAGLAVARVGIWESPDEAAQKSLDDIYSSLDEVMDCLHKRGYMRIFGVGKSFGGAVMLMFAPEQISRKVLWAPAIGAVESEANFDALHGKPLGSLQSLLDLQVDKKLLGEQKLPILIIHGTEDEAVPSSNSEKLVAMLPRGEILRVTGADHSYRNKDHEGFVITATIDFLTRQIAYQPEDPARGQ